MRRAPGLTEGPVPFNAKPLRDAEALLDRGDLPRASEKLWDAVTQAVKLATREWTAEGPREMRRLVDRLFRETGDRDLLRLFSVVDSLRANGAENFMSEETLRAHADDARALVEKLVALADRDGAAPAAAGTATPESLLAVRQQEFAQRVAGLPRRDSRREVLAELARVEGQLENLKPLNLRHEAAIPGFPESRIASALHRMERLQPEDRATADLARYKTWLLELLVNPSRPGATGGSQTAATPSTTSM